MRSDRRGLALVLVMTVVLALTIIATPFVLSMILQERSGTMSRYASQADWGADGARNFALWKLMPGLDPLERRAGANASYYYDVPAEFDVRLDDATLASRLNIADPKGSIWGLSVHDEQGKLNVRTAPDRAINRVKATVDDRIVSHKDFLTLYSGRDSTWVVPQRIRSMGSAQPGMNSGPGLWCDSLHVLAPESRVRISKPGLPTFYAKVTSNEKASGGPGLSTSPAIPASYMEGVIEVEARHPVNINTARREVLAAVFDGLAFVNQPASTIDAATANRLANAFFDKRLPRLEEFLRLLGQQGLNPLQYQVVALNAVCPSWAALSSTGTVPFCFKSYDVYTVEGGATMSNPAGASVASRGFREVVSVSPPLPLTLICESQLDFDSMVKTLAVSLNRRDLLGFPYGNRITTYPNILPSPYPTAPPSKPPGQAAVALKSQQGANEAYVMAVPGVDFRGASARYYEQDLLPGWPSFRAREHFDNDQEGMKVSGSPFTLGWQRAFTTMPPPSEPPNSAPAPEPHVAAGGVEFWARFDSVGSPTTIFDIRERDTTNRLTLRIEGRELILTACDGTIPGAQNALLDDGTAEIRQPFVPLADTWYHFGAYWQGTRYAQLALLVDGFAHPDQKFGHYASDGTKVIWKLTQGLPATGGSLSLANQDVLPPNTLSPFLIGGEVVLYDYSAGTLVRGARGTTAVAHQPQTTVSVFGYASRLVVDQIQAYYGGTTPTQPVDYRRIPVGGGTLVFDFGANPQAVVRGDKFNPMNPIMRWVDSMQGDIYVLSADINAFPEQGYILIDNEAIFYTGRSTGAIPAAVGANAKFTGCVRGQSTTLAARHDNDTGVAMWGFSTTDTDPQRYDPVSILQIGDEWFGPLRPDDNGRAGYWIPFVYSNNPVSMRRGITVFMSIPGAHSKGDEVIPTFLVRDPEGTESLGRGDLVTVMDAMNNKEVRTVNHASPVKVPQGQTPLWPEDRWRWQAPLQIAAFRSNVSREVAADGFHSRILKFPSGELLGLNWLANAGSAQLSIGGFAGTIDEVKCFAGERRRLRLAAELAEAGTSLAVTAPEITSQYGGLLKIGDEYMGYGEHQNQMLTQVKRPWLGSTGEVHDLGDPVFWLRWVPITTLSATVEATDRDIPLRADLLGLPEDRRVNPRDPLRRNYSKGYVLIDEELILFEWNADQTLGMPPKFDGSGGLYRGMFGTSAARHDAATALVYGIPWRYWDTYKVREFDNTMSYWQWSTRLDGANWRSLQWTEEIPSGDKNIVVHALLRLDGKAEFWEAPGQTGNVGAHLFEFAGGGGKKTINRSGYQQDAGQLDVRFYWEYKPSSFDARAPWTAHSWKRAPKIKELRVEYDRPTQVLHHEDR